MPASAAHPVRTLREHATALEAALSVCLAEPDKRAVHKLRTETRRIEAQIALLKLMRGLPPFRKAADNLLKQSKKLRRAAGDVRDLDVQHKLIKEEAAKVTQGAEDPAALQQRFDELLVSRGLVRDALAKDLLLVLGKRQAKVAGALESLLSSLKTAEGRALGTTEMLALVDRAFQRTPELRRKQPDDDALHSIRKAAKRARYQLEAAPPSIPAKRGATAYESLQDAGGLWHDWMELAKISGRELGEHHQVTAAFAAERDRHLRAYERLLEEARGLVRRTPKRAVVKQSRQPVVQTDGGGKTAEPHQP